MCGIAFRFDEASSDMALKAAMQHCLKLQHHRGPDASNIQSGDHFVIGHSRLSILDLEGSSQPMMSPCQRYLIAFNGEIYNYQEIRKELSEWPFSTSGDTEVLLAGLILRGVSVLSRMEGMWAFILWDRHERRAIIGRDRFGKKPLFFELGARSLSLASELGPLRQLSQNVWSEDTHQRAHYFKFGYVEPGSTIYAGVKELLPGEMAIWSPSEGIKRERYYRLKVERFSGSKSDASALLCERFQNAVRKRMVADVEVGVFLSGGIDSSLISSVASELAGSNLLKAFSIGFSDRDYDESRYFRQMAGHLGVQLCERNIDKFDPELLKRLITRHVGQPFHDSSILPTWLVSQLASEHVKVVLTGDGADEIFCGYERYRAQALFGMYRRLPMAMRLIVRSAVRRFDEPLAHHSRSLLKKMLLFVEADERYEEELPYRGSRYFSRAQMLRLLNGGEPEPELELNYHLDRHDVIDGIRQMMFSDVGFYMPQDILVKVDRASMANSLEARSPFLDTAVVELAVSLPVSWLLSFYGNKKFLRKTFRSRLPDSLWYRRKQGFAVPIGAWFHKQLGDELENMLAVTALAGLKETGKLLLGEHRSKRRDNGYRLWLIYIYLLWAQDSGLP